MRFGNGRAFFCEEVVWAVKLDNHRVDFGSSLRGKIAIRTTKTGNDGAPQPGTEV